MLYKVAAVVLLLTGCGGVPFSVLSTAAVDDSGAGVDQVVGSGSSSSSGSTALDGSGAPETSTPPMPEGGDHTEAGLPPIDAACGACATPPILLVQSNYAATGASATSVSLTFSSANVAGDLIALAVGWTDTTSGVVSVADMAGNTYAHAVGPTIYSPVLSQNIYYAAGIKAATSNKITVTMNADAASLDLRAAEFAGLSTSAPLDQTAASSGKGGTAATSGAVTTTHPYELLFGAGMSSDLYSSAGSGFTLLAITPNGNIFEYEIVQAIGSYAATGTQASSGDEYVMQIATFR
jgi:hypothetical protein